jgi:hypothetical protein
MTKPPKKGNPKIHLITGEPKRWSQVKAQAMQLRLKRKAAEVAADLDAENVIIIGFWPAPEDRDVIHHQAGGTSPWPLGMLFSRLARQFGGDDDTGDNDN